MGPAFLPTTFTPALPTHSRSVQSSTSIHRTPLKASVDTSPTNRRAFLTTTLLGAIGLTLPIQHADAQTTFTDLGVKKRLQDIEDRRGKVELLRKRVEG